MRDGAGHVPAPREGDAVNAAGFSRRKRSQVLSPLTSLEGFLRMSPTPPPLRRPWLRTVTMYMSSVSQARSHCSGSAAGEESRARAQSTDKAPDRGRGMVPAAVTVTRQQLPGVDVPASSVPAAPPAAKRSWSSHLLSDQINLPQHFLCQNQCKIARPLAQYIPGRRFPPWKSWDFPELAGKSTLPHRAGISTELSYLPRQWVQQSS